MITYLKLLLIFSGLLVIAQNVLANIALQTGDIIFHVSTSQQSTVIQKATHSPYSHMGMIVNKNGKTWVLEAIQPVQYTTLDQWVKRGVKGHYVVKRMQSPLTVVQKQKLVDNAEIISWTPIRRVF